MTKHHLKTTTPLSSLTNEQIKERATNCIECLEFLLEQLHCGEVVELPHDERLSANEIVECIIQAEEKSAVLTGIKPTNGTTLENEADFDRLMNSGEYELIEDKFPSLAEITTMFIDWYDCVSTLRVREFSVENNI